MTEREEMFDLNCACVISDLVNLCSVFRVAWFLVEMKPFEDTLKQFTVHVNVFHICQKQEIN